METNEMREITTLSREELGRELRRMREKKGFSKYRIAKETGFSFATIKNVEDGARSYEIDTLVLYLQVVDMYLALGDKAGQEAPDGAIKIE